MTPLTQRLWTYQAERFPLAKTLPLLLVFSAASVTVSAGLSGRAPPGAAGYAVGFALALILFFQMRVCDEVKDLEDDRRYRPERPIPRGLIGLRVVVWLGLATVPVAALLAFGWGQGLPWLLALVWLWLALMTWEFGAPSWLKARPVLYLLSHMAIMPLIDLLLTAVEWGRAGAPHPGLAWFLGLSFVNGCVLEIGRKLWAEERQGVETYSKLWGRGRGAWIWLALVAVALALLIGVGAALGRAWWVALPGGVAAALCAGAAMTFARAPSKRSESRLDLCAGLWVFLCYASAGAAAWMALP